MGSRDSSTSSIIAYQAAGAKHNVVLSDAMLEQVYSNRGSLQEHRASRWAVLRNTFGMPKDFEEEYFELQPKIEEVVDTEMFKSKSMETLISASCKILSDTLPDLVTFNSSIVDQMQWERVATIELTDGTSEAECDLFSLINDFCCNAILGPIAGVQFPESYQLLASDLADLNKNYYALSLGLPRLSPIRGLPTAALAKKRLIHNFTRLFSELTSPPVRRVLDDDESASGEETDADTTTPLATLNALFTEHDVPIAARAAIALDIIHDITAEVVPLVFWTLLHIYSQETPLTEIKTETQSWARAVQPPSIHPLFPAPPEITYTSPALATTPTSFPHLRSCINEARRLYTTSSTTHTLTAPITLTTPSLHPSTSDHWALDTASHLATGLSRTLINSSPTTHPTPTLFNPTRFLTTPPGPSILAPSPSTPYKTALLLTLLSGICQLWDLSPAPKKTLLEHLTEVRDEMHAGAAALDGDPKAAKQVAGQAKVKRTGVWVFPRAGDAGRVKVPVGDVRVRVRRREGLGAPGVARVR